MAQKQGAEIYFGDPAHIRPDHRAGRTWGKKGETPIVETTGARHGMSPISAISSRGHMRSSTAAALVGAAQVGKIVVTGSHGGLLGGRPETALKIDALAALFNDAGIGIDEAGVTRLPALDGRGIAAGTVAATSARIGDARSTYDDGILTRVNRRATALGIAPGMTARQFVDIVRRTAAALGRNG